MDWKRGLGIGLVFVGIFIIAAARAITGAIVGSAPKFLLGWFGILILIAGMILVLVSRELEDLVSVYEFKKRIYNKEHNKNKISLILDTSAILPYEDAPEQLEEFLKEYKNTFVPDSVLDEIANPKVKSIIREHSEDIEGYEKYRETARKYLERTEKPTLRRELLPYLNGEKHIKSGSEQVHINRVAQRIRNIMLKERLDSGAIGIANEYALNKIRNYLERHCKVSDADADVLAMALNESRCHQHAIVGERDIDLKQAIDLIKKERPKLGKNLDYVEVYTREYVHVA